jgi:hypothetical protein
MAAPTNSVLLAITDSIAKAITDFAALAATATTSASSINSGISGTGASNTLGRVLALAATPSFDPVSEQALIVPVNSSVTNVTAYHTGITALNAYYQQFLPFLNAFDNYINANITTGGVNAWLTANALQVNAYFAAAHNYLATNAIGLGLRTSATVPTALSIANYFPFANVNPMFTLACTGATAATQTVGSATSTQGGGVANVVVWKSNAGVGAGGATLTITYVNAAGVSTVLNSFSLGSLSASGSISSGSVSVGISAQSITSITGTGMTNAETYVFGEVPLRTAAY